MRRAIMGLLAAVVAGSAWAQNGWEDFESAHNAGAWYVAGYGSWLSPTDSESELLNGFGIENEIEFDDGWGAGLAVGKYAGPFRAEFEAGYKDFDIDNVSVTAVPGVSGSGDVGVLAFMGNGYVDIDVFDWKKFVYLGAGAGIANVSADLSVSDGITTASSDESDWVFAWQAMAGVAIDLTEHAKLTVGYRGFTFADPEFDGEEFDAPWIHSAEIGVRFAF